ncbi:MAG: hypothetical protein SGI90_05715 [Candidatus Eisenbacteria bacterium]|nr:hypothetical protein [Candidatus Eisenbacteria bacterium]
MSPAGRRIIGAALLAYLISLVVHGQLSGWNLVDDAMIACRAAANVANGFGPVFNPGVRFESWSSPAWVAFLSAGARIGMDLPSLARALGVLSALLLVALVARLAINRAPSPVALCVALVLGSDPGLAVWSQSGLETAGFALALFAAVAILAAWSSHPTILLSLLLGGLGGALALFRPEGMLLAAWLGLVAARQHHGGGRYLAAALLPTLLVIGALLAWRLQFYGAWLPASAAAKLVPRGDAMLHGFLDLGLALLRRLPLVLLAALGYRAIQRDPARDRSDRAWFDATAGVLVILGAMTVLAGGDWMGRDRFLLPLFPLLAIGAAMGGAARRTSGPALLLVTVLAVALPVWQADRLPPHGHAARQLGEWLAREFPDSTRLGVAAAGAIPFHAGFWTIDALGITDPDIARRAPPAVAPWKSGHMHYDTARFLAAKPDIIVWEFGTPWCLARMSEPSEGVPMPRGDYRRELLRHPTFRAGWRPVPGVPPHLSAYFTLFRRTDN